MKCCDNEAEQKYLKCSHYKGHCKTAKYCIVFSRIQCIKNESNNCVVGDGKTWKRPNIQNAEADDFDQQAIKDVTEDFY
jgi:hypothetical protein